MQLGLVGLGRMGGNMRERLRAAGHEVVGFDHNPEVSDVATLAELVEKLAAPRVVWVMVPAGVTDATIDELAEAARRRATSSSTAATPGSPTTRPRAERLDRAGHRLHRRRRLRRRLGPGERLRADGRRRRGARRPADADLRRAQARRASSASCTPARSAPGTTPRWSTTASSTA